MTGGGATASSQAVLSKLKELLLERNYKLYIQSPPRDAERAVRALTEYIERDGNLSS